jgi:outer membrane receptor protein involved in Fe transport
MAVLTESDIQSYGGASLVEVIDRSTSVFFMGTQENLQGALTMRGDATLGANNHILILVNGRPLQESTHGGMIHPFLRSFPLASVKQIEIIRGPGSVLYGTNAYVGVINVITKDWTNGGAVGVSYGAFNTRTLSAAGGRTNGGLRISAGMTLSHDDGWDFTATDSIDEDEAPITRTVPWTDRKLGANVNVRYLGVSLDALYGQTATPHLTNSSATTSWLRYGGSDATQAMVDLGYKRQMSARWASSLHATYNRFAETSDFGELGTREVLSSNYLAEWANDLRVSETITTVFGANLAKRTGHLYEATFLWFGVPHYNRNSFTAFAQADYTPIPRLKLIAGGQVIKVPGFTTYAAGGELGEASLVPGLDPRFVGRLGAVVTLTDNLRAKLLYSEAFRQPSVVETDFLRYDRGRFTQEGNPELRPEAIATTDLQLSYGHERVNAAVTLFNSRQSNVIGEIESFVLIQNFSRFQTRGSEVEALVRPMRNLEVKAAVTYQTLQTDRETQDVFASFAVPVPSFMAKVGLSYRTASGLTLAVHDSYFGTPTESSSVSESDPTGTTQFVNPTAAAFHHVTANLAYRLRGLTFPRTGSDLTMHVYVNNLLDEEIYYAEYTSVSVNSLPGRPGRAIFAGVAVGF